MQKSKLSRDKWSAAKRAKRAARAFHEGRDHRGNPYSYKTQQACHDHWARHYIRETTFLNRR